MRTDHLMIVFWATVIAAMPAPAALATEADRPAGTNMTTDGKTLMEPYKFDGADRVIARAAELGYSGVDAYMIPTRSICSRLLMVRFAPRSDDSKADAFTLLRGLVDIEEFSQQTFVAMKASAQSIGGREHTIDYLFWHDPWNNWRSIDTDTQRFFQDEIDTFGPIETPEHHAELMIYELELACAQLANGRVSEAAPHLQAALTHLVIPGTARRVPLVQQVTLLGILLRLNVRGNGSRDDAINALLSQYAVLLNQQPQYSEPNGTVAPVDANGAQDGGVKGWVLVEYHVGVDGRVRDPVVIDAYPAGVFDAAAIESTRQYRFKPAMRNGKAVESRRVRTRIRFTLDDSQP